MAADVEPSAQKFSRYRSVRRANNVNLDKEASPPPMPVLPANATPSSSISRSMSRYHRQRPTNTSQDKLPTIPAKFNAPDSAVPPLPNSAHATTGTAARLRAASTPYRQLPEAQRNVSGGSPKGQTSTSVKSPKRSAAVPLVERTIHEAPRDARDEARHLIDAEAERQKRVNAKLQAERKAQQEVREKELETQRQKEEDMNMAAFARRQEDEERRRRLVEQEEEQRRLKAQLEEERARNSKLQEELERSKKQKAQEDDQVRKTRQRSATLKKLNSNSREPATPERLPQSHTSPPSSSKSPDGPSSPNRVVKNKFGFLHGKRHDEAPKSEDILGSSSQVNNEDAFIKAGGGGVVPGIDAPISAVNAGDRRVLVQCNASNIRLPVTPTTTPVDLIRTAETCLSEDIDLKTSVLLESFNKVGVQRPLRRYEHVRDVMNSWDDDSQNSLILVMATHGADEELTAAAVTDKKPEFFGYIYHSNRPGRWKKEWVTLHSDGQMVMAKNETHKDVTNVCHLSDFDIYTPTEKKISKSIRPPKKICFAIKSQQKSAMFLDTSRFVHFFCTNDRDLATQFYKAVQGWRSWYLVNVMGEGKKAKSPPAPAVASGPFKLDLSFDPSSPPRGHQKSASIESHYQLGTFQPLLDMNQFSDSTKYEARPPSQEGRDTKAMHARKMSLRNKAPPPSSFPTHLAEHELNQLPPQPTRLNALAKNANSSSTAPNDAFTSTGLLGRTYSQRKKAIEEREHNAKPVGPTSAFTSGPSLLNDPSYHSRPSIDQPRGSEMRRSGTTKTTGQPHRSSDATTNSDEQNNYAIRPSTSLRRPPNQPKPLVDLSPVYKEPPQFLNKGRGFKPDNNLPGGLIEAATSLEQIYPVPPSNDWRARAAGPMQPASTGNVKAPVGRGAPIAALHTQENPHAPERSEDAFTGSGLLASASNGWGDGQVGRGVMDGSRARGPMLDMTEDSRFAKGSLLRHVERQQGPNGPLIDREKRTEGLVETGEGLR